jgi:branched-subunit amino acid transport protein
MMVAAVAVLAVGTYVLRLAGIILHGRLALPAAARRLLPITAAVLLTALAITGTVDESGSFAGFARMAGVAVALMLAWRRAPFVVTVVAAALSTALLRLLGVQ